jgi:hypothetical protein
MDVTDTHPSMTRKHLPGIKQRAEALAENCREQKR